MNAIVSFPAMPNFGEFDLSSKPPRPVIQAESVATPTAANGEDDEFGDFNQANHFGELGSKQDNNAAVITPSGFGLVETQPTKSELLLIREGE